MVPKCLFSGNTYESESNQRVTQLGYDLLDYVVGKNGISRNADYREWENTQDLFQQLVFIPGVANEETANNQISIDKSKSAHDQWVEFIDNVAETSAYKLIDFVGSEASIRKVDKSGEENVDGNTLDVEDDEKEDKIEKGVEGQGNQRKSTPDRRGCAGSYESSI